MDSDEEDAAFESLCKFYVGMTRPARALYLFSEPYSTKSKSKNFIHLLAQRLKAPRDLDPAVMDQAGQLVGQREEGFELVYHGGSPAWWEERSRKASNAKETPPAQFEDLGPRKICGLLKFRPSAKSPDLVDVDDLLRSEVGSAQALGTEVHSLFEKMEWWEKENSMERWLADNAAGLSTKSSRILSAAFEHLEVRRLFEKPEGNIEVWREKSFVWQRGDHMVQGVFDRVVLYLSEDRTPIRAEIIDFKTDRLTPGGGVDDLIERHQAQVESYRQALKELTGLPADKISLVLLFTSIPKVHRWT